MRDLSDYDKPTIFFSRKGEERRRLDLRRRASVKLTDWLRSGDGVFWISGKAASGKSTLMKFIRNSTRANRLLEEWAGGNPSSLIVADYYFWHPGSDLQKSHEGLYRTLLWQMFHRDPQLVGLLGWSAMIQTILCIHLLVEISTRLLST